MIQLTGWKKPLVFMALGLLLAGCPGDPLPPDLEVLADPSTIEGIEDAAREQLGEAWKAVEKARARSERADLLRTTGDLGELLHAYRLPGPAATCYRNAERLEPESFLWPYLQGVVAADEGRHEDALVAFERALERAPEHAPTHLRRAEVQLTLGHPEEVAGDVGPLVAEPKLAAKAHALLGRAARETGDDEAAVLHFQAALDQVPEAAGIPHVLGLALRDLGRLEEAEAYLGRQGSRPITFPDPVVDRLERLPESSGFLLRRGNRALLAGDFAEAEGLFAKATEADSENPEAWRSLALAHIRQGDAPAQIEALRRGLETSPDHVWLLADLGTAYLGLGRLAEAEQELRRTLELAPDLALAHQGLGQIHATREEWKQAAFHLDRALEEGSESVPLRRLQALAASHEGRVAEALVNLRALVAEDDADTATREALADVLARDGRVDEAAQVLGSGAATTPAALREQARLRGEMLWRHRRYDEALAAFEAGVEADPESAEARIAWANALQHRNQRDEAVVQFRRATELDPDALQAWISEGLLLIVQKQWHEARDRLERAVALHPDNVQLVHTLARLLATAPVADVRDGERSFDLAREALAAQGTLDHSETVAMALAELGRYEEAIAWQRGLAQQASQRGENQALRRLVQNLRLYEARRPVRVQ